MYVPFKNGPFSGTHKFLHFRGGVAGTLTNASPPVFHLRVPWDTPTVWSSASTDHRKLHTDRLEKSNQLKMYINCNILCKNGVAGPARFLLMRNESARKTAETPATSTKSAALVGIQRWNPDDIKWWWNAGFEVYIYIYVCMYINI